MYIVNSAAEVVEEAGLVRDFVVELVGIVLVNEVRRGHLHQPALLFHSVRGAHCVHRRLLLRVVAAVRHAFVQAETAPHIEGVGKGWKGHVLILNFSVPSTFTCGHEDAILSHRSERLAQVIQVIKRHTRLCPIKTTINKWLATELKLAVLAAVKHKLGCGGLASCNHLRPR